MTIEDGQRLRNEVIATARAMSASGINVATSGNVSARCSRGPRSGFVVTPSAIPYDTLVTEDLVFVDHTGATMGPRRPSSEWRFHFEIYAARTDIDAIVHTHSPHATALACQGLGFLGLHLDDARNEERRPGLREISTPNSPVKILVIPTNEELEIARQCAELLSE